VESVQFQISKFVNSLGLLLIDTNLTSSCLERRHHSTITNISTSRGAASVTDHYLAVAEVMERLPGNR
jgi:hypothetical protein